MQNASIWMPQEGEMKKQIQGEADFIAEGKRLTAALVGIEAKLPVELTSARLSAIVTTLEANSSTVKRLRSEITAAIEAKDASMKEIKEFMKRAKAGAKAAFGDDSLEYERLGGKRMSERKKATKKTAAAAS
jgi:hypothetical protein